MIIIMVIYYHDDQSVRDTLDLLPKEDLRKFRCTFIRSNSVIEAELIVSSSTSMIGVTWTVNLC